MTIIYILFVVGLLLIIKGGDWFVDAAEWIAELTGIPHFVVGATIVSLATTLPELFVSVNASIKGYPEIAIGNVVGSVICNTGLVAGIIIIFTAGAINRSIFIKKGILLFLAAGGTLLFATDLVITNFEVLFLLGILAVYIYINVKIAKDSVATENTELNKSKKAYTENTLKFIFGTLFIILGANLLVENGIKIADYFNVPKGIVALTLVALGTSLPELITGVSSIVKGKHDIGLGNIIGANILNFTVIIPIATFVSEKGLIIQKINFDLFEKVYEEFAQTIVIDLPVAIGITTLFILPSIIMKRNYKIQGGLILASYIGYIYILFDIAK